MPDSLDLVLNGVRNGLVAAARRESIGSRIRRFRRQCGMTQDQIADVLGCARSAVSMIESGQRKVSADELIVLACALDVTPNCLLGIGVTDPTPKGNPMSAEMESLCEHGCVDPPSCDDCAAIAAELADNPDPLELVRRAIGDANEAAHRLTTLYGPLWHSVEGRVRVLQEVLDRIDSLLHGLAFCGGPTTTEVIAQIRVLVGPWASRPMGEGAAARTTRNVL